MNLKFSIEGVSKIQRNYICKDRNEAVKKFMKENPLFDIECVGDTLFIGFDEFTNEPIFEDDDYICDIEGCYALRKNIQV